MLSCCWFCSGKFRSPRNERPSSPRLLSEFSCLLSCILLLLLIHIASSNLSSHHGGQDHLCDIGSSPPTFPSISMAASVTAVLLVVIMVLMSVSSFLRPMTGANYPPIVAWKVHAPSGPFNFSRSNLRLGWFGFLAFFRRTRTYHTV